MLQRLEVPLAPLTTLGLGGPAHTLLAAYDEADLVAALRMLPSALVLGGGSNVVLPDEGVDEVVLVRSHGLSGSRAGDRVQLEVAAGEGWDALVASTVADGLVGLEALSGIPGTVGASPVQNVGAYGSDVASTVVSVRALDTRSGAVVVLPAVECAFAYRDSCFKAEPGRWVVVSVLFSLADGGLADPVRYAELARTLGVAEGARVPAAEVRAAVLSLRRSKGMVLDASDPDSRSAGSFFTNPLVEVVPEGAPSWPAAGGKYKISAAWLMEQAGFTKGWGSGPVGLSSKHALALVHRGGGTTEDLLAVARLVRAGVRDRFGVTLVNEPVLVGVTL